MKLRGIGLMMLLVSLLVTVLGCRAGIVGGEAGLLGMWLKEDCLKRDGFVSEKSSEQLDWAGEKIRITNKVGTLNLRTHPGSQLLATAEKHVRGLPLDELALEVSRKTGEISLQAKTPGVLTCERAWLLDISLNVPESAELESKLLWGHIDLRGQVRGKFRLRLEEGEIYVTVPPEASLRIRAEIGTRGRIDAQRLAAVSRPCGQRCLETVIGTGQGVLQLEVDSGIITLTTQGLQ